MCQTQNALLREIDRVRELMVESAQVSGFTSDETVRCSQELDRLIYEYQCLCKEKELQRVRTKVIFRQMLLLAKKQYILSHA